MFKKYFLSGEEGPLGRVVHHFVRIEYQKRGTQHFHMLLWIAGAPKQDAPFEEKKKFIDAHMTARLPNPKDEPELYDLVMNNQRHWATHTATCLRTVKYRNKIHKFCRFEFPRPVNGETVLNEETSKLIQSFYSLFNKCFFRRSP
ncbi:hypothetical protein L596_021244 [Steinernema carpocapsae]|uniref:Uncharacterized protein n=1 Tax=Steinernema carpocapsae TaxID=34508 RepID=A0A4U5MW00_STECR|nr:hypothetical protein L596_021244 [Steinernema carpocapsae]